MVKMGVLVVDVAMLQALATALGMVVVLEMEWMMLPPKRAVLDALKMPETWSPAPMDEEALEMKPPPNVERLVPVTVNTPPTSTELDADTGP